MAQSRFADGSYAPTMECSCGVVQTASEYEMYCRGQRDALAALQRRIVATAKAHGWYENARSFPEDIALLHSEVSEALEWWRKGNGESDHIPGHAGTAEEMADVLVRVLDLCARHEIDVLGALPAKLDYNDIRPYRHGEKRL